MKFNSKTDKLNQPR